MTEVEQHWDDHDPIWDRDYDNLIPCTCFNGYECSHRCWCCGSSKEDGCVDWCHIRPFDEESE